MFKATLQECMRPASIIVCGTVATLLGWVVLASVGLSLAKIPKTTFFLRKTKHTIFVVKSQNTCFEAKMKIMTAWTLESAWQIDSSRLSRGDLSLKQRKAVIFAGVQSSFGGVAQTCLSVVSRLTG